MVDTAKKPILSPEEAAAKGQADAHYDAAYEANLNQLKKNPAFGGGSIDQTQDNQTQQTTGNGLDLDANKLLAQLIAQKTQPLSTSDKLQTGLTILSGGLIPTPGFYKTANRRKNPLTISDLTALMTQKANQEKQPYEIANLQAQTQKIPLEIKKLEQETNPEFKLDYAKREYQQKTLLDAEAKAKEELAKANQQSEQSFNQIMNLSDNMASALKGAYAQQGGSGPIRGMIGNAKSALGLPNTGNIKGLKEVKRATAISYARTLAQGSRGAVTLFNSILQSMPDNKFTSEQAGTTLAEMGLTAYALHKGIMDLGLSKDQVNSMSSDQLRTLMEKEKIGLDQATQDKIYNGIAEKFKNIAPRQSVDLEGNISNRNKSDTNDSEKLKSLGLDPNRFEIVR